MNNMIIFATEQTKTAMTVSQNILHAIIIQLINLIWLNRVSCRMRLKNMHIKNIDRPFSLTDGVKGLCFI